MPASVRSTVPYLDHKETISDKCKLSFVPDVKEIDRPASDNTPFECVSGKNVAMQMPNAVRCRVGGKAPSKGLHRFKRRCAKQEGRTPPAPVPSTLMKVSIILDQGCRTKL
jgi:hypothetical protein